MPLILKAAKSLPKSLPDMIATRINEDPISKFASEIQKVNSRTDLETVMKDLSDAADFDLFCLGGAVVRGQELFAAKKSEFKGHKSFAEYIENTHGIQYGKALRAAQIYRKLIDLNLPWSAFESIGWTKVRLLLDVVTKDNIKEWVAIAKEMNWLSLKARVDAENHKGEPETKHGPKPITTKTFKLHADQKQLIEEGLKKASEETGSVVDSVNLKAVFQSYLFPDVKRTTAFAAKHADDPQLFVEKQITALQHLFPQLNIAVEITWKEAVAAST
jgi:hypothetical protein